MKNVIIFLAVVVLGTVLGASAEDKTANQIVALQKRVASIEAVLAKFIDDQSNTVQNYKIAELERKVAGMQKQITILHGKKEGK